MPPDGNGIARLIKRLDAAVDLGDVATITKRIKDDLQDLCACGDLQLPEAMTVCCGDSYARRLLHRDERRGYTVVVMTWGPGQHTNLHDHAGIWCVECVVCGELEVTRYDLLEERDRCCRFRQMDAVRTAVGDAGCLIRL